MVGHWFPVGVGCAAIGLAPWLATGCRLPLQNLWADQSGAALMPLVLLPWSQYAITQLWSVLVTGWLVAGATGLLSGVRSHPRPRRFLIGGVVTGQLLAVVQTAFTVAPRLIPGPWSVAYMGALVALCAVAAGVGVVTWWLVMSDSSARAAFGWCLAAPSIAWWLKALWYPLGYTGAPTPRPAGIVVLVVPGLVMAGLVARVGLREAATVRSLIAGICCGWALRALLAGVQAAAGSRALLRYPSELASMGGRVVGSHLTDLRALSVPLGGVAVGALIAWARPPHEQPPGSCQQQ